jgi:hypothetical protein
MLNAVAVLTKSLNGATRQLVGRLAVCRKQVSRLVEELGETLGGTLGE